MKKLRATYFRKVFALIAGIIFLNMSFIIAELSSIGIGKENTLLQNIMNSGFEEEEEGGPESSEADPLEDELYFSLVDCLYQDKIALLTALQFNKNLANNLFDSGYREIFSPPPEA
jgi:hypothetical protein